MKKELYHFKLGFPKGLKTKFGIIPITYTALAQKSVEDSKHGKIVLPSTINTTTARCVEAEVKDRVVTKLVYRIKYNNELDMILMLNRDCSVKNTHIVPRGDKYQTVELNRYTVPPKKVNYGN